MEKQTAFYEMGAKLLNIVQNNLTSKRADYAKVAFAVLY